MLQKDRKPTRRKAAPKAGATPGPGPEGAGRAAETAPAPREYRPAAAVVPPRPAAGPALSIRESREIRIRPAVSTEERAHMIAEAAYFRAQRRGFRNGDPVRDWAEAEAEIDAMLLHR
jgi:DUF2934 family protein